MSLLATCVKWKEASKHLKSVTKPMVYEMRSLFMAQGVSCVQVGFIMAVVSCMAGAPAIAVVLCFVNPPLLKAIMGPSAVGEQYILRMTSIRFDSGYVLSLALL